MHFGIICPHVLSHLIPMSTIGRALQRKGHKVTLFGISDMRSYAENASLDFEVVGVNEFPKGVLSQYLEKVRHADLHTLATVIKWGKKMSKIYCHEISEAIARLHVDALLVDQVQFEGLTISEIAGIPFITICNAIDLEGDSSGDMPPPFLPWSFANGNLLKQIRNRLGYKIFDLVARPAVKTIDEYRRSQGLPPFLRWDRSVSTIAVICNMTPGFNYNRRERKRPFYYTGPFLDEHRAPVSFPYDRLNGKPIVYASMGTIVTGKEKVYRHVAEACMKLPLQLVMSMGKWHSQDRVPEFPGDPIVVPFVPQLEILRRATVVITHAGANTVMEALAHGCPLLAIPITTDQPAIANRLAWTGAGKCIPLREISPSRIRSTIEEILNNHSYRERARVIQREIQECGGVEKAVDIIERTLNNSQAHPT